MFVVNVPWYSLRFSACSLSPGQQVQPAQGVAAADLLVYSSTVFGGAVVCLLIRTVMPAAGLVVQCSR
jgi:hypothetical protein